MSFAFLFLLGEVRLHPEKKKGKGRQKKGSRADRFDKLREPRDRDSASSCLLHITTVLNARRLSMLNITELALCRTHTALSFSPDRGAIESSGYRNCAIIFAYGHARARVPRNTSSFFSPLYLFSLTDFPLFLFRYSRRVQFTHART